MMGPFFPNGAKPGVKAQFSSHFSDEGPAPSYFTMLRFQKAAIWPAPAFNNRRIERGHPWATVHES